MLVLHDDGQMEPFNLKWLQDSEFELLPPTRDYTEGIDGRDVEIDFGTEFADGEIRLHCASPYGDVYAMKTILASQLNDLREYNVLVKDGLGMYVRLKDKPEVTDHPNWFEVSIPLSCKPYWFELEESTFTGNGVIEHDGRETPLRIQIHGPCVDPEINFDGQVLKYLGELTSMDIVTIDTELMTVKFNNSNSLDNYNGVFPWLTKDTNASSDVDVTYRWHVWR